MANMRLLAAGVACSMLGLSDAAASCATLTGAVWTVDATSAAKCTETAGVTVAADAAACAAVTGFGATYAAACEAVLTADAADAADAKACTYAANTCDGAGQQWIGDAGQESFSLDSPWSSPKRKTWWTKRLVSTDHRLYFGGQPSVRDVKYLYEQGYDAVYMLYDGEVEAMDNSNSAGQASPAEEESTAAAAGLLFARGSGEHWYKAPAIDALEAFIDFALANTNGPIYVHCGTGFYSAAVLQMYRLRKAAAGAGGMTVQGAIDEVAVHGFDISTNGNAVDYLFSEAGTTKVDVTAPTEDGTTEINLYHWMKYLGAFGDVKMFDAGQIHSTHIAAAKAAGIKVVVNMRKAVTSPLAADNDKNSQEETNLLNLGSAAKTKNAAIEGPPAIPEVMRTDSAALFENYPQWVTESTRPTSWVGDVNGAFNFESENALEFGDDIGYNADLEKAAWALAGIEYIHIPIGHGSNDYSAAKLLENHVEMMGAITTAQAAGGHVLWHCRTGYRTGAFPSALFSVINGDGADAVGARMAKLGYDYAGNLKKLIDDAAATLECADCKCDGTAACTGTFKMKAVKVPTSAAAAIAPCVATLLAAMALWA